MPSDDFILAFTQIEQDVHLTPEEKQKAWCRILDFLRDELELNHGKKIKAIFSATIDGHPIGNLSLVYSIKEDFKRQSFLKERISEENYIQVAEEVYKRALPKNKSEALFLSLIHI